MCSTCATLVCPQTTPGWGISWWTPGGQCSLQGSLHTQQCPCCPVGLGPALWQARQPGGGLPQQEWGITVTKQPACTISPAPMPSSSMCCCCQGMPCNPTHGCTVLCSKGKAHCPGPEQRMGRQDLFEIFQQRALQEPNKGASAGRVRRGVNCRWCLQPASSAAAYRWCLQPASSASAER